MVWDGRSTTTFPSPQEAPHQRTVIPGLTRDPTHNLRSRRSGAWLFGRDDSVCVETIEPASVPSEPTANLSPRIPPVRIYAHPLHRSEIMTSGWCSGGRVVRESFRTRPKVPRHGPVRRSSRCKRAGGSMRSPPGSQAATHEAAGKGGDAGGFPVAGRPGFSRCGTGCSRVVVP